MLSMCGSVLRCIGLSAVFVIACNAPSTSLTMGLAVDPKKLDFGTVLANPNFAWQIPIKNCTYERVVIDLIKTSCSCTVASGQSLVIEPGQTEHIGLQLDLSDPHAGKTGTREFAVAIIVESTAAKRSQQWTLSGTIVDTIRLSSHKVNLGEVVRGRVSDHGYRLDVKSLTPLRSLEITSRSGFVAKPLPSSEEGEFFFDIFADPPDKLGQHQFPISLSAVTLDGKESVLLANLHYVVVDEIGHIPESSFLGTAMIGEKLRVRKKLFARNGHQISIESVAKSDDSAVLVEAELSSNDDLELTISPSKTGRQQFEIGVKWRAVSSEGEEPSLSKLSKITFSFIGLPGSGEEDH